MVKVLTGRSLWACMSATTAEESIPPDRNAPSGTSASIRILTASRSSASNSSRASAGDPANGSAHPRSTISRADQYASGSAGAAALVAPTLSRVPGGSLETPRKIVYGLGTYPSRRYTARASRSMSARNWG